MVKPATLTIRLPQAIRDALDRAAEADDRSVSYICEKALSDWLTAKGWLKGELTRPPSRKSGGRK